MEQKIKEYFDNIKDKNINLASDHARGQIVSDIMQIINEKKCNCGKPYDYTKIDRS